ncbi:filamentous hemagglutinin N-terminal domain-containing protein [Pseudomonas sp. 5P_3.1_Bac2]|uniref:two-partner secretion domain-containing protein n=1 Tax=Pseudomonas sp. 5P_3.1_Bac2 TaxID=2971617 RepID=UPI0021C801FC|nr:filamentous hemagglutinin N-terminal domain-containing protein [Pseudomonas sp. 5P_3.1_Bac2]MCU1719275.1 filamentous hemagglutinin N-terminal domain-containing protein [Pseudomonas sp. 5P_3.1_Bac2]
MDVRQFSFLAAQPSAAFTERDRVWGLPKRGLAFLLANVMFWQPLLVQASEIVASNPNTAINQAGNGVPVVNIATPNGSGLSHNQFKDYNVGANGVILNNATGRTQATELGGIILGNPNLSGGAAQIILNEVNGGSPSQLRGYTEVAGQAAKVIVANPYGISCNGCGFINTPNVTLTTGKPVIDNQRLDHYQVDGGAVSIDGQGLNASNVDRFEIITRSAQINAQLNARNLAVIAGRNDVNAQNLTATPRADDGSAKPELAIDSSVLGGMYAGAIKLVGTEAGVGVKLDGSLAASAGDIQLDVNGRLSLAKAKTNQSLQVKAQELLTTDAIYAGGRVDVQTSAALTNQKSIAARDSISLSSQGQLLNQGIIEAGVNADDSRNSTADVSLNAAHLVNQQSVVASRNLSVNASQTLNNQGGTLSGKNSQINAQQLDNRGGRLLASDDLKLTAKNLNNRDQGLVHSANQATVQVAESLDNQNARVIGLNNLTLNAGQLNNDAGLLASQQQVQISAGQASNRSGEISAKQTTLNLSSLDNRSGKVLGDSIRVTAGNSIDNRLGIFSASRELQIQAQSLDNSGKGNLVSQGSLNATITGLLDNHNQGNVLSQGAHQLTVGQLDNSQAGLLSSKTSLALQGTSLVNQGGTVIADGKLAVTGGSLDNSQQGLLTSQADTQIEVNQLTNQTGRISSAANLQLTAAQVDNGAGRINAKGDLNATVGSLNQQGGELLSEARLTLAGNQLDNRNAGLVAATQGVELRTQNILNQQGEISSQAKVMVLAQQLQNSGGKVIGDQGLSLSVERLINQSKGLLAGREGLVINAGQVDNSQGGRITSQKNLNLTLSGELLNHNQGTLLSDGAILIHAGSMNNSQGGTVSAAQGLAVSSQGQVNNQGGKLLADGTLSLSATELDNSHSGVISAKQNIDLHSAGLNNSQRGSINSDAEVVLNSGQLDNSQQGSIFAKGQIKASVTGLNQQGAGELVSSSGIDLDLHQGLLDNHNGGLLATPGQLLLRNLAVVDNSQGGEISSKQSWQLSSTSLNNQGGKLISSDELLVRVAKALDNSVAGVISAQNLLQVEADSLNNQAAGALVSRGAARITVNGALDNRQQGLLSATKSLDVTTGSLLNSDKGQLWAGVEQTLNSGELDNSQGGQLTSDGSLSVSATKLNNASGVIASQQALSLTSSTLDNRAGLINSQANLNLHAAQVNSSDKGEISAKGDLQLTAEQLIQRQGRLIGERGVTLDLLGGDLNNDAGLISAKGPLSFANLRNLSNREQGEISSQGAFAINAQRIDNGDRGVIVSADQLSLDAATLINAEKGLLSGWNGLSISGGSLDNSAQGTLSSKSGSLQAALTGGLNNQGGGALVSQGQQTLTMRSLDNRGGIISGQADVSLSVVERLDNSDQGLISAGQALEFKHAQSQILNRNGQISAGSINLLAQSLDNSAGQLLSQGALQGTLSGALINANNARLASGAALLLDAASLDNRGGQLVSQADLQLTLRSGDLDNSSKGTLASQRGLLIKLLKGDLNNQQDGLIYSQQGQLDIAARSLHNQQGTLQSQTDNLLRLSANLNNQGGRIDSLAGNLDLSAVNVDNSSGGVLNSRQGRLKLVSGLFDNRSGISQGKSLDITANNGLLNQLGHLSALAGDAQIVTTSLNNQGGGLYADSLLKVSAQTLDNQGAELGQGGKIGARTIDFGLTGALNNGFGLIESDETLRVSAQSISNTGGNLRAMGRSGETLIRTSGLFDNRFGVLESANEQLNLQSAALDNNGGRIVHGGAGLFQIASDQVTRAGGSFITNGQLDINATSWVNSSVIQAGRLNLNIGQFSQTASGQLLASQSLTGTGNNWQNDGLLASDGSVDLRLSGTYSGNGRLTSLAELQLTSGSVDLAANGRIAGGALSQISSGTVNNYGRITAVGDLRVDANNVNNYGTLGGSQNLRISAEQLLNEQGLLFSGRDMTLRVNDFSNRNADVYSLGALDVARDDAGARSRLVENISASIESASDMRLLATTISNRREQFSTEKKLVSGNFNITSNDRCKGKGCELYFDAVERYEDVISGSSAAAFINAGGDFTANSQNFDNLYSSVSAAKNILINTDVLTNRGAAGGEEVHLKSGFYTRDRSFYNTLMERQEQFNLYNDPTSADYQPGEMSLEKLMDGIGNFFETSTYTVPTTGSVVAQAVIQAGGAVNINATQQIDNSVIRPNTGGISAPEKNRNTDSAVFASSVKPAITAQLPPDLAQRQVNPVTLPGFSLPSGQNGLFRLSGQAGQQGGASTASTGVDEFVVGARQITAKERDKALSYSAVQERGFSIAGQPAAGAVNAQGPLQLDNGAMNVKRVQGLPEIAPVDNRHKYLIETNPALTDLKQFMSSDYLLGKLGVNPDETNRRLGDGLYEQRLIRDAIVQRTGQRYIDGIASDDELFRYLMDNAIAYKDSLNLQLGVALSAEQVAALTHDIVWMEEAEVNGQKVLVPVLYLAQANNRLAPNGALIQGQDVSLISGGDLHNSGTLRATNNLNMVANNIDNSGLMQAGNRLQMLATDSISNSRGGIVSGRDVSAQALTGDIINERTVTSYQQQGDGFKLRNDVVSAGSRFEASDRLDVNAGRDLINLGSTLSAGGDASIRAGRDLLIASQTEQDDYAYQRRRVHGSEQSIEQHASSVEVGGNLELEARRDLTVIGSRVSAEQNLSATAGQNLTLAAAANEDHEYSKGKKGKTKTTIQEDEVSQQSAELKAGGDLIAVAGKDLTLLASKIGAGDEAYVHADNELNMLAAQDSNYSLYDMKKKGSWGSKKTQRDEVTQVTNVGSEIITGGDLTLSSGSDQRYQGAKLESGGDLTIASGGAVTFEAVKDLHQESHEKSNSDWAWTSAKGKGTTDETLRQTQMVAQGEIAIRAAGKINIDIQQIDQQSVSQTIDAMVQVEPQLAWIKQAEANGEVDWRLVKEIHDGWDYKHSGLGAAPALIISIIASYYLGPLAGALVSNFAVGTINGGGDIGAGIKAATNKNAIKGYATQVVTQGVLDGIDQAGGWGTNGAKVLEGSGVNNPGYASGNLDWNTIGNNLTRSGAHTLAVGGINTAIYGGSLKDHLGAAAVSEGLDLAAAFGNKQVGDLAAKLDVDPGSAQKVLMHAILGGALSAASGGDFKTGALAGAAAEGLTALATEKLGQYLDSRYLTDDQFKVGTAQIIGLLAGALGDGDPQIGSWVAGNAERYNAQLHREAAARLQGGFTALHNEGKYLDLQPQDVLTDLQKIVDGEKNPANLNPRVVAFLNEFPPAQLREALLEPTENERLVALGIDLVYNPTPAGKAKAAASIGETLTKDALEALERKYGEAMLEGAKATGAVGSDAEKIVTVSKSRFPESAQHIEDAIDAGKPGTLTIDRGNAASRRRDSLRGTETKPGLDRDEYPPAMFQEGGQGSSVRHINPSDNRGAGACIGAQCRELPNGTKIRIDVVD